MSARHRAAGRHRPARARSSRRRRATCCGTASRSWTTRPCERVRELGGLAAIAISHPHFYSSMTTWSAAFGDCPVYIHAADAQWVQYRGPACGSGRADAVEILPGRHADQHRRPLRGVDGAALGGRSGGAGRPAHGRLLTVVMDRRWLSFMYSYPNLIPLRDARGPADRGRGPAVPVRPCVQPVQGRSPRPTARPQSSARRSGTWPPLDSDVPARRPDGRVPRRGNPLTARGKSELRDAG